MKSKGFNISLIVQSFINLEKVYKDLLKNLKLPKEAFAVNKLVVDKVRTDFNIAFESAMRPCRHISQVLSIKTTKHCLYELSEALGFPFAKDMKDLSEFYVNYRDLKKDIDPNYLYDFLNSHVKLFRDYAEHIINYIKTTTKNYLLIDYDFLNEKAKHVKDAVEKLKFVLSKDKEEFLSKPMYFDRAKYFYQVAYDALFDICRHLAPKFKFKNPSDDCLVVMAQANLIENPNVAYDMMRLKNKLITTWDVNHGEFYETLKELLPYFEAYIKELSSSLKELVKNA
ncbi:DUF86 domain-containing protein [Hydrogenobaculum acidophilum]